MPDAKAIIRISAMPDSQLRKALAGTVEAARRQEKQSAAAQVKAAKDAEREKIRASKEAVKAAQRAAAAEMAATKASAQAKQRAIASVEQAARRAAVEARKEARAQAREAERLAKEEVRWAEWAERLKWQAVQRTSRMAERAAAQQRREATKTARQQVREAQTASTNRRRMAMAVGGAAVGIGVAAVGRVQGAAGAFGARSRDDMAVSAVDFKRRLKLLGDMGGVDAAGQGALQAKILETSAKTGIDASALLGGLERAHDRFTNLKGFATILEQVAKVSVATGTDVESVVGAMGVMRRQFQLTDAEMVELSGAMVTAADLGNVSFQAVADNFASALGSMGRNANLKGTQGAVTALGLSQIMGASDKTAPEIATLITNMMTSLTRQTVREHVALPKSQGGFGVKLSDHGVMRDLPTVIRELSEAGFMAPQNSARRGAAFPDNQAREAMEVLVTQFERDPETVNALLGMKPNAGNEAIERRFATMNEGVLGQAATLGARQFATFMESGEFDRFLKMTVQSADGLTQLTAKYPLMTEAADLATGALKGLAAAILAERAMGLGGAPGGGALGGVGGAPGATGKLATAGKAVGGALGVVQAGLAGYYVTDAALQLTGLDKLIEQGGGGLFSALHYEPTRSKTRGIPTAAEAAAAPYSMATDDDYQSREPLPWTPAPVPGAPQPTAAEATLNIRVHGPGQVTSVSSDGFGEIALMSVDTGRRDVLPP